MYFTRAHQAFRTFYLEEFDMSKQANGGSAPKTALPSSEQDQIRRAHKAKQRGRKGRNFQQVSNLTDDLFKDKLNARLDAMFKILDLKMVSPSESSNLLLKTAQATYAEAYASTTVSRSWKERHEAALAAATTSLDGPLKAYATRWINQAERRTRPVRQELATAS